MHPGNWKLATGNWRWQLQPQNKCGRNQRDSGIRGCAGPRKLKKKKIKHNRGKKLLQLLELRQLKREGNRIQAQATGNSRILQPLQARQAAAQFSLRLQQTRSDYPPFRYPLSFSVDPPTLWVLDVPFRPLQLLSRGCFPFWQDLCD